MADPAPSAARLSLAQAQFERIMTSEAPAASGAFMETGTLGFVFGELWQRDVLTVKERRWITIACAGATGSAIPIEAHVWAALNSGDITYAEYDEFVLHFATQLGWPKASVLHVQGVLAALRLADERQIPLAPHDYETIATDLSEDSREGRGAEMYLEIHGVEAPEGLSPFTRNGVLGFLYGDVWSRTQHLSRRERRIVRICCTTAVQAHRQTLDHLESALRSGELTVDELQEIALHVGVYLGWIQGRELDDLVAEAEQNAPNEGDLGREYP